MAWHGGGRRIFSDRRLAFGGISLGGLSDISLGWFHAVGHMGPGFVPGGGGGWRGGVLRPAVFTDFGLQLAWGRPEGHRGWGGAFTLTGSPVLTASALALGRSRRPGGGGADVVSGTSCSLLPAGPWGVVRWGVRRVCGFAAGVARGGAGVGARSERAAALLRGRFGSCSPVSVSSVRCLCCRDALEGVRLPSLSSVVASNELTN